MSFYYNCLKQCLAPSATFCFRLNISPWALRRHGFSTPLRPCLPSPNIPVCLCSSSNPEPPSSNHTPWVCSDHCRAQCSFGVCALPISIQHCTLGSIGSETAAECTDGPRWAQSRHTKKQMSYMGQRFKELLETNNFLVKASWRKLFFT